MKARLNTFLNEDHQSFSIKLSDYYHALNELHYHPEIELLYVIEGEGTLLIGEHFEQVSKGMLLMIGGNIPGQTRVLSMRIYDHVQAGEYHQANVLSLCLLVVSFAALLAMSLLRTRRQARD